MEAWERGSVEACRKMRRGGHPETGRRAQETVAEQPRYLRWESELSPEPILRGGQDLLRGLMEGCQTCASDPFRMVAVWAAVWAWLGLGLGLAWACLTLGCLEWCVAVPRIQTTHARPRSPTVPVIRLQDPSATRTLI